MTAGVPLLIGSDGLPVGLERLTFERANGIESEDWLQDLIHRHPECLPFDQIEPGIAGPFKAVRREMAVGSGIIDHVLIGPRGDIAIVETKLWRNPEARREVIAQVLGYAVSVFSMSFEEFQKAATRDGTGWSSKHQTLHAMFSDRDEPLDEARFNDAVARNLRLGRAIVLVVGDGVREDAARLLEGIASFAQFQFTLAMARLEVFKVPSTGAMLIIPNVVMRTETVIRHVIDIADSVQGKVRVHDSKGEAARGNLTPQEFYRDLEQNTPGGQQAVSRFVDALAQYKIRPDFMKSLNLRWFSQNEERRVTLMHFYRDGQIWTDAAGRTAPKHLADSFVRELGSVLGAEARPWTEGGTLSLYSEGGPLRLAAVLDRLPSAIPVVERFATALEGHYSSLAIDG